MDARLIEKYQLVKTEIFTDELGHWWKSKLLPGLDLFVISDSHRENRFRILTVIKIGNKKWQQSAEYPIEVLLSDFGLQCIVANILPKANDLLDSLKQKSHPGIGGS